MSATQKACDSIREMIVTGKIPPGASLREGALAEAVGVSRTPIREALRLLTASGLAQIHPNQGASVAVLTRRDAEEIFSLRVLLEGAVAAEAAERLTDDAIDRLEELQDRMEDNVELTAERLAGIAQLNRQFHLGICDGMPGSRIAVAAVSYIDYPVMLGTFHRYSETAMRRGRQHHRELIEAFRSRDGAWAEAVMRCHILAARNAVISSYAADEAVVKPARGTRRRKTA